MKIRRSIGYTRLYLTPFLRIDSWSSNFKHVSFGWMKWEWGIWFQ